MFAIGPQRLDRSSTRLKAGGFSALSAWPRDRAVAQRHSRRRPRHPDQVDYRKVAAARRRCRLHLRPRPGVQHRPGTIDQSVSHRHGVAFGTAVPGAARMDVRADPCPQIELDWCGLAKRLSGLRLTVTNRVSLRCSDRLSAMITIPKPYRQTMGCAERPCTVFRLSKNRGPHERCATLRHT